jgi:hypothetical protein
MQKRIDLLAPICLFVTMFVLSRAGGDAGRKSSLLFHWRERQTTVWLGSLGGGAPSVPGRGRRPKGVSSVLPRQGNGYNWSWRKEIGHDD